MTKIYEIRTTDWQLNGLNGTAGSRTELEATLRGKLAYMGRGRGVMTTWQDGTRALYETRSDARRDSTGEHAIAIVTIPEAD